MYKSSNKGTHRMPDGTIMTGSTHNESSKPLKSKSKSIAFMELLPSTNKTKKLMAIFYDGNQKKVKTTHFGSAGMLDFTKHPKDVRDQRKKAYITRHEKRENWNEPTTAGALSKHLLWNLPTLEASWKDYKKRFGIKKLYKKKV